MPDEIGSADTYPQPAHGWTCFHCGQTFHTPGRARDHFGADPLKLPACRIKYGDEMRLVIALREAEDERDAATARADAAEQENRRFWQLFDGLNRHQIFTAFAAVRDQRDDLLADRERLIAVVRPIARAHAEFLRGALEPGDGSYEEFKAALAVLPAEIQEKLR